MWRICFLVLAFSFLVMPDDTINQLNHYINAFIDRKCQDNCNEPASDSRKQARINYNKCLNRIQWDPYSLEDVVQYICKTNTPAYYRCLEIYLDSIEDLLALDSEEQYFKGFSLRSFNNTVVELCKENEDFLTVQLTTGGRDCYTPPNLTTIGKDLMDKCIFKSNVPNNFNQFRFVIRDYILCGDLKAAEKCVINYFYRKCYSNALSGIVHSYFRGSLDWCAERGISVAVSVTYEISLIIFYAIFSLIRVVF